MFCFILRNTTPIFNGKGRTHSNSPPIYFRVKGKNLYQVYNIKRSIKFPFFWFLFDYNWTQNKGTLNSVSFGLYLIRMGQEIKIL